MRDIPVMMLAEGVAESVSRTVSDGVTGWQMSTLVVGLPAVGLGVVGVLVAARQVVRGMATLTPGAARRAVGRLLSPVFELLPALGRVTRALSWTFLFAGAAALLLLPYAVDPFGTRAPVGTLSLTEGPWLISLGVMAGLLAAALSAWETDAPPVTWVGLLLITGASLAAMGSRVGAESPVGRLVLPLACVDAIYFTLAFLLARTGVMRVSVSAAGETGLLRQAVRWSTACVFTCSVLQWAGLATLAAARGSAGHGDGGQHVGSYAGMVLIGLSILIRLGVWPAQSGMVSLLSRCPVPVALMMSTAGVPVTLQIASLLLPQLPGWVTWTLVATSGASLLASLRERDLRRAVARWLLALAAVALATLGKLPPEDRRVIGCMLITGALTASTACTFLAGLVAQSCGHTEISRLRGLASRAAGVFGWMVLAVLLLSGAPPGAVFTAMLVCPAGVPVELAILLPVAAGVTLAVVHRTFLGLPTDFTSDSLDDPATIRISGRQRLALLLLISASLAATLAPATLLRP